MPGGDEGRKRPEIARPGICGAPLARCTASGERFKANEAEEGASPKIKLRSVLQDAMFAGYNAHL
jgi:hypothetical protein